MLSEWCQDSRIHRIIEFSVWSALLCATNLQKPKDVTSSNIRQPNSIIRTNCAFKPHRIPLLWFQNTQRWTEAWAGERQKQMRAGSRSSLMLLLLLPKPEPRAHKCQLDSCKHSPTAQWPSPWKLSLFNSCVIPGFRSSGAWCWCGGSMRATLFSGANNLRKDALVFLSSEGQKSHSGLHSVSEAEQHFIYTNVAQHSIFIPVRSSTGCLFFF